MATDLLTGGMMNNDWEEQHAQYCMQMEAEAYEQARAEAKAAEAQQLEEKLAAVDEYSRMYGYGECLRDVLKAIEQALASLVPCFTMSNGDKGDFMSKEWDVVVMVVDTIKSKIRENLIGE